MARVPALRCATCRRSFGGDRTFRDHRILAGDRHRCRTEGELLSRGLWRAQDGVWHRGPASGQLSLLGLPERDRTYPGSLYGGVPPHEQVTTSAAAAHSVATIANTVRGRVLGFIRDRGEQGATDDEVEEALDLRHQTASARRRELYLLGEIRPIGERHTRSGRRAKVWVGV